MKKIAKLSMSLQESLDSVDGAWPSLRENVAVNGLFLAAGELITALAEKQGVLEWEG